MGSSRKSLLLVIAVSLVLAACSSIEPLRVLKKLRAGLKARDETAVAALVDFAAVRSNAQARTEERLRQANQGKLLGGLRAAVGERIADRVIEKITTPRGMIGMVCDSSLREPPSPPPPCSLKGQLSERHAESDSRYSASLTLPDGKLVTLIVERQPDQVWRVVDIMLSPESFEKLRNSIAD